MCALAASADGTLYGIGADDGILYTIDKETAALTEVGPTGVTPENTQSATIDGDTGQMYWSAYTADGGALYTVDTATGKATHVFTYPDKAHNRHLYPAGGTQRTCTAARHQPRLRGRKPQRHAKLHHADGKR